MAGVRFFETAELDAPGHAQAYDAVTCMEVLEHCVDAERRRVLDDLRRFVAPGGRVIVSAPIEIGPALLGKQFFRARGRVAGARRLQVPRDLHARASSLPQHSPGRISRARSTSSTRPSGPLHYCGHKGFDWRTLEREIAERFVVEQRLFTPLGPLGALLNSQVWFVCR